MPSHQPLSSNKSEGKEILRFEKCFKYFTCFMTCEAKEYNNS